LDSSRRPAFVCVEVSALRSQGGIHTDIRYAYEGIARPMRSRAANPVRDRIETFLRDHEFIAWNVSKNASSFGGPAVCVVRPVALRP
jgi:hypothetical protein